MRNKQRLYSIALASIALILYLILVSSAVSAASVQNSLAKEPHALISNAENNTTSVIIESPHITVFPVNNNSEVRGPVFDGSNIIDILSKNGGTVKMDANRFAAFYYNLDNHVTTELLSIKYAYGTKDRVIGKNSLVYQTIISQIGYEYEGWGAYPVLGFFTEQYIPLKSNDASKLAKLVIDSDDKYTLKTGEKLDLGQGYTLEAKQVDVDGKKAWLEFDKDGQFVDDQIVSTDSGDHTWTCEVDKIQGEDNTPVLKVHVNQVFQGAFDSIAQIDGIWLIDYANAIKIESDDEFGKLNNVAISGPALTISNADTITLTRDSEQEIGQGMYFKVADSNDLRFYVYKQITEPGTYQVRGQIASGDASWNAFNFAGFFYDLNKNIQTESLAVSGISENLIPKNGLVYKTTIGNVDYKSGDFSGLYPVLCLFAEQYVPLKSNDASKLAKLVIDSDDKYTLKTGEKLDLGKGYVLEVKDIDDDGNKVWLEFTKDGEFVDGQIFSTDYGGYHTWTCEVDKVQGEDNVPVLKVHVNQVFQGPVGSIAQIDGLWLIDYANAMKIESDDEFGKLNNVAINGSTLTISNDDTFTLTRDSEQEIGQGIYFKVADSNELRYYPYIEKVIGEDDGVLPFADFSTKLTQDVAPLSVQFTDSSQNAIRWNWDFGDGVTSTEQNPIHVYSKAGTYTVSLTAGNANGIDTKFATITVAFPINDNFEARGPMYNGSDITDILNKNGGTVTMDANNFLIFYYDLNNNVTTETLSIKSTQDTKGRVIGQNSIVYSTTIGQTEYRFEDWGTYPFIGLFGDMYIPIKYNNVSKLAKLVVDSNDKYTLKTGEKIDLGRGYALEVKEIDVDGKKVWLEFTKDGQYVDDEIIATYGDGTWTCRLDNIQGENDVLVLKVHVNQVFQDTVNRVVQIDGLWLIDYTNAMYIHSSDESSKLNNVSIDGKVISENDLKYNTIIENVDYNYSDSSYTWDKYPAISLFGKKYVPLKPADTSKLAKLVLDSNYSYTLKTGEKLDLGQGYTLEAKQIDVDGKKVWLEFDKDGQFVDDQIVSTDGRDSTWTCELDEIQGEDNVPVLKVHVSQVFQGVDDGIDKIDGLWLIDYANAVDIYSSNEFGKLNYVSINGATLSFSNKYAFSLTEDSEQEIAKGIYFKVADTPENELRFYAYKQITEPGTYEVRGQVASGNAEWNAFNFAGFFYDLKENVATESLEVSNLKGNVIQKGGLEYSTTIKNVDYKSSGFSGLYPVLCLFAEEYVPLKSNDASKLAKLVVDSNDKYTLKTGEKLDLGKGYALEVKDIDDDGKKVWLEFTKDGEFVDDQIISTDYGNKVWTCEVDKVQGEDNVPVLKVHVNQVFQGPVDRIAQIDGLWLIDYANAIKIESDDEFGKLNNVAISGPTLTISNDDIFTLNRNSEQEIGQGMYFKVADTNVAELRYFPYVEKVIGEDDGVLPVANFNANPTSGYAPLSVQFTDLSQYATSRSWDFGDGATSTYQNPTHTYSTAGTYTVSLIATNENVTSPTPKTAAITVTQESSSSSSSGGSIGGSSSGAGGSPEPASNVQVKELSQAFITNGKLVKFDFPKNATCVAYVSFDSKKTAGKTTTIVEQLKNKSTLVSELTSGEVYKYFNVWIGTGGFAASKNIENPVVCFKVEKSWLQDENIDQASITLNRYSDKKWSQLPVILLSEDSKYLYFTAETPEFSFFAITGKAVEKEKVVETKPATDAQNPEKNSTAPEVWNKSEQGKLTSMPGFGIVCGIVCLIAVFLYKRK